MSKFEVGETIEAVRDLGESSFIKKGDLYIVTKVLSDRLIIEQLKNYGYPTNGYWRLTNFRKLRVIHNRLAEKLYPNGRKKGKWWVLC